MLKKRKIIFSIKTDYKIIRIEFDDVLYIEALQKYIRIHTAKERYVSLISLSKILELLDASRFIRIHRSYIINVDKINSIEGNQVSIASNKLPISKGQREPFLDFIKAKGLFH